MGRARVAVIGAGPGGLAAARRLAEARCVDTILVQSEGIAVYPPGIIPMLLGLRPASGFRRRPALAGVELRPGTVIGLETGRVHLANGAVLEVDAIIAAPGLLADARAVPEGVHSLAVWDLAEVEAARGAVEALSAGQVVIAVMSLPYRCPPAPYGLAMALRALYREQGRAVAVAVTTPEVRPLAALDGRMAAFLEELTRAHEVVLHTSFVIDRAQTRDGVLVAADGRALGYDLGLFVPPHGRPAFLADLPGTGPLVTVDAHLSTAVPGVWVVGDVAATPLPRAAGVATAQGHTAAEAVLAALGCADPRPPIMPAPSCYVWTSPSTAARIGIAFPNGPPPDGVPTVELAASNAQLAVEALAGGDDWGRGVVASPDA
ncbi:MAG: hypothetical protein NVSMB65_20830 [Chloroflexota bacterium]